MKKLVIISILFLSHRAVAQGAYQDSINQYLSDYVKNHEVVTADDQSRLTFFPVAEKFRVTARFEPVKDGKWFSMETSGAIKKTFRVYGYIHFSVNDTLVKLAVYQSQNLMQMDKYKDLLFLPFTDLSSGEESYAGGRYIDLHTTDITNTTVVIDFNKAYNPYCAYVSGKYNCPIPPRENQLPVKILAGEKTFRVNN